MAQKKCINDLYEQARRDQNGIKCSNDRTYACVCRPNHMNFWYGIRDCALPKCGNDGLQKVRQWRITSCGGDQKSAPLAAPKGKGA
jgi:hypothetical protein